MTTTSTPLDGGKKVTLSEPSQLIAGVGHLLGFRPADSVVLIGRGPDGKRIAPVLRGDLPAREQELPAIGSLARAFHRQPVSGVTIVIVGEHRGHPPHSGRLPHVRFVKKLMAALGAAGVPVDHAVWTPEIREGAHWECYHRPRCSGVLPDENSTVLAAAMAGAGHVTFASREDMLRQLDPDDPAAVERRERLLEAELDALTARGEPDEVREELFHEAIAAVSQASQGGLDLSDERAVRLALALSDIHIRNAFLSTALPPGSEPSRKVERLWLELLRRLPAPERAEPAVLLAYSAYVRGDGAMARMACETALDAHPHHAFAAVLLRSLDCNVPPQTVQALAKRTTPPPVETAAKKGGGTQDGH